MKLTFGDDSNEVLGSLSGVTDIEGMHFTHPIPEPSAEVLFGIDALLVGGALLWKPGCDA